MSDERKTNDGKKLVMVVVNGREKEVSKDELTFSEIVQLAFGKEPEGGDIVYTITYKRGAGSKPEGSLTEGQIVKVKEGMIINATRTDKS